MSLYAKDKLPLKAMRTHLASANYPEHLPEAVKRFYTVTGFDNLLLSPRGVHTTSEGVAKYSLCQSCFSILTKNSLPKFSIANGFAIGALPDDLQDLRAIEVLLCSMVHSRMQLLTVDGGCAKVMRGHCVSLAANVSEVQDALLPRSWEDMEQAMRVVVVGARTPQDKINFARYHVARPQKLRALLAFLRANNHHYAGIHVDESRVSDAEGLLDHLAVFAEDDEDVADIQRHFAEARGYTDEDGGGDGEGNAQAPPTTLEPEPELLVTTSIATATEHQFRVDETEAAAVANAVDGDEIHLVRQTWEQQPQRCAPLAPTSPPQSSRLCRGTATRNHATSSEVGSRLHQESPSTPPGPFPSSLRRWRIHCAWRP